MDRRQHVNAFKFQAQYLINAKHEEPGKEISSLVNKIITYMRYYRQLRKIKGSSHSGQSLGARLHWSYRWCMSSIVRALAELLISPAWALVFSRPVMNSATCCDLVGRP